MKVFLCFLLVAAAAQAGEYAVLASGFRIHADSHVSEGPTVRLQTSQGVIEMPVNLVTGFEQEDYTAPAPTKVDTPVAKAVPTAQELIRRAAVDAGLPPAIVQSVAKAESGFRQDAVSPKGAIGLMQLMPATAAALNADPYDAAQNAEAGAKYLHDLLVRYQSDPHQVSKAVAAYNAGPAAVDKYNGVPPYPETIQYVNRVLTLYEKEQQPK